MSESARMLLGLCKRTVPNEWVDFKRQRERVVFDRLKAPPLQGGVGEGENSPLKETCPVPFVSRCHPAQENQLVMNTSTLP